MLRHPQKTDPATGRGAPGAVVRAAARIVGGGQLHSLPLSSGHADHGCGRQPALRAGDRIDRSGFERENKAILENGGVPMRGVPGPIQPGCPAPHEVAAALVTAFKTPPAARRGAVVPSEHRAQHPGGVPRIPAVVAAGSAARHPVRGVPVLRAAVRAGGGIHPLLSGPGFRDSGGRNSRDQRCAEGRDHRDRHLFPTTADDRQYHTAGRSGADRSGPDARSRPPSAS